MKRIFALLFCLLWLTLMGQAQQFYVLKAAGECTLNGKPITLGSSITLSSAEKEDIIRVGEGLILREKSGSTLNFPTQGEYLVSDVLAEFVKLKSIVKNSKSGSRRRRFEERGYDWVSHIVGQPIRDNRLDIIHQSDYHFCGVCGPPFYPAFTWSPGVAYHSDDILITWQEMYEGIQYVEITLLDDWGDTKAKFRTFNNYFYLNMEPSLFEDHCANIEIALVSDPSKTIYLHSIRPYDSLFTGRYTKNGKSILPPKELIDEQYQSYLALNNIEKITTSADKITEAFFFEHIGLYLDAQRSYFQAIALASTEAEKKIYEQIYNDFGETIGDYIPAPVCRTAHSCSR